MSEIQPDLAFPNRCISVHWSLPTQCERDKSHFDKWHWARHPDTGIRIRYRRTLGVYVTEELRSDGQWHTLQIPPPVRKDVAFLLAEVERLTAEGAALSERRDYYLARCEQMERDHAETVAEVARLRAAEQRVRTLVNDWQRAATTGPDGQKPLIEQPMGPGIAHVCAMVLRALDGGEES